MKHKRVRRQIFVFTPEEKRVIACVLAALALGFVTSHFRNSHPRPPVPPTAQQQRAAQIAKRSAAAKERAARIAAAARATPVPAEDDDE